MLRKFLIRVNGNEYEVEMEEITEGVVQQTSPHASPVTPVQTAPEPMPVTPAKSAAPIQSGASLEAPMPGTILNILVSPGQQVTENQPLLILEAMKMENEIVADRSGTITAVHVQKGEVVNPGQPLLEIG